MEPSSQRYSALIIDDSPHMRILMSKLLQRNGFTHFDVAVNGADGLQHFTASNPDIVFLDAVMPELDGLSVLRQIKSLKPDTIVAMTTSLSEKEKVLKFKEAGADYYLLKPFEEGKFTETLQEIVAVLDKRSKKE
jgi:two-component system chemotaxis response regulator CheY